MFPIRDTEPAGRIPTVVPVLIGLCLAVFVFQSTLDDQAFVEFLEEFALIPSTYDGLAWQDWLRPAALWPFVTHMFLHGSAIHVAANLWTLWIFGDNIEAKLGPLRFLLFYLLCGLAAAGLQLVTSWGEPLPMVGASGAIAGVMGAYLVLCPRSRIVLLLFPWPVLVAIPAVVYLGYWLMLQVLGGLTSSMARQEGGGVAWFAHLGGFVAGLLLQSVFARRPRPGTHRGEPS